MALSVPKAPGVAQMLKDGARVSKINCHFHENSYKYKNYGGNLMKIRCLYVCCYSRLIDSRESYEYVNGH